MAGDRVGAVGVGRSGVQVVGKLDVMMKMILVAEGVVALDDAGFYRLIHCKSAFVCYLPILTFTPMGKNPCRGRIRLLIIGFGAPKCRGSIFNSLCRVLRGDM